MAKKSFSFQREETTVISSPQPINDIENFIAGNPPTITRKTIAIPEEQFKKVKIEAAKRGIPAYQLWGEIVDSYFEAHSQ